MLGVLHDSFRIRVGLPYELPQAPGIVENELIVCRSNRRVEVAKKQVGHALLVVVSYRHCGR